MATERLAKSRSVLSCCCRGKPREPTAAELAAFTINIRELPDDAFSGPLSEGFNIMTLLSLLAERLPHARYTLLDLHSFEDEDRCCRACGVGRPRGGGACACALRHRVCAL